jgi:hypothetical protein
MLAREREQIKENILVTNEDERGTGFYPQYNAQLNKYIFLFKLAYPY